MKHILYSLLVCVAIALTGCGNSESAGADALGRAEDAMYKGDWEEAQKICTDLYADSTNVKLSATQYAQLSLLFMQLSDNNSPESNTANAISCYRHAVTLNADSANAYYSHVAGELSSHAQLLSQLVKSLDNPNRNDIEDFDDHEGSNHSEAEEYSDSNE